mmetsp:Transcript_6339/g.10584  ORF Transcript_6339/g.10584 Transcript_6339/m.10584 type:complete len:203 (-) Transcript_6339:303-911(-)
MMMHAIKMSNSSSNNGRGRGVQRNLLVRRQQVGVMGLMRVGVVEMWRKSMGTMLTSMTTLTVVVTKSKTLKYPYLRQKTIRKPVMTVEMVTIWTTLNTTMTKPRQVHLQRAPILEILVAILLAMVTAATRIKLLVVVPAVVVEVARKSIIENLQSKKKKHKLQQWCQSWRKISMRLIITWMMLTERCNRGNRRLAPRKQIIM